MSNVHTGIVQRGSRRGKTLGFPTANISLKDPELSGIYAARVTLRNDESPYMAAVFADQRRALLEAHVLDFSDELYGETITVELFKKIREHTAFDSDTALREAIAQDVKDVREYFKQHAT